ncbi:protein DEHYDRATION-INDUCED 19 homolog 4-like isoform X1 [Bidens hawaiensis]|uniref:protein DEHYDRATION-INDUCED 19 homolog 4-like isoform X1 n=1 Tax=Bidens hawaiensis TaxID=980011 RepID=UPI0040491F85
MRNSINDDDSFHCRVLNHLPVDSYIDLEDSEEDEENEDESNMEMVCPYCSDGFDALGLCVHLEDQHPLEIKLGVCPLCATNLGKNMISHLIIQHESALKGLCKRKLHDDEPFSIVSLLRKKLQEHSRTFQRESASVTSLTNSETDPLLFSFVNNSTRSHEPQADSFAEPSLSKILPKNETPLSNNDGDIPAGFFTSKDHEEKAQKSDFVQTILLSTIFTDDL